MIPLLGLGCFVLWLLGAATWIEYTGAYGTLTTAGRVRLVLTWPFITAKRLMR